MRAIFGSDNRVIKKLRLFWGKKGYLFVIPSIAWVFLFTIFPLLYSLRISFYATWYGKLTKFIGLKNYGRLIGDYRFWSAIRVTFTFVTITVLVTIALGMVLALIFNRKMQGVRLFRGLFCMPLFTAPVALGYLGVMIFYEEAGPINTLVEALGLAKIPWLSQSGWAMVAVCLVDIWQWTPFVFLVLLAGLQSLPEEIYEAALLDSSSSWDIFRYVTFPLIAPVLGTVTILRIVEAFKVFDVPFSLTNGGPGIATRTLTYYAYVQGLRNLDLGYGAAMAYVLLAMMLVVSIIFFGRYSKMYE
ncbi:MAG: sugar ABC transporter permease [Candidatus Aerophobus sp.]|nr:MAG: sugar ABC transporter permease [Candidatus Aerophobus sp.]